MGGKHKQAQRTKNNARPSSSGRSAELLGSTIPQFVGFSAVKEPGFILTGLSTDDVDSSVDVNFQLVLKKMNKKDSTTKLKALQEFADLVKNSEPDAVKAVLAFWPRLYGVLATDTEHRVREATHVAHHQVVLKAKRNLAPYLKSLAGPWFTSQYDTYAPAASAATESFHAAFPPNKLQEAIIFCQEEILSYICDNIIASSAQMLSSSKTLSTEDAEAKYERILISSLQGYSLYLNKVPLEHIEKVKELHCKLISSNKFWKLAKNKVASIRSAWFGVVIALCQKAPFLLENENMAIVTTVLGNLDETEPTVLSNVWEAALLTIITINEWWKHVNIDKILQKLFKVLSEGGQGNASAIYPNLLPFISNLPPVVDYDAFYTNCFNSMKTGLKQKSVLASRSESLAVATAFVECFQYVILKNEPNVMLCEKLIKHQLIPVIEWCLVESQATSYKAIFNQTSKLLQYWSRNCNDLNLKNYEKYLQYFFKNINSLFQGLLINIESTAVNDCTSKQIELLQSMKHTVKSKKQLKVKFNTNKIQEGGDAVDSVSGCFDETYLGLLNDLVYNTSEAYVKIIDIKKMKELVEYLLCLIQDFDSEKFFMYLIDRLEVGDSSKNLFFIYENLLWKWLNCDELCSKPVVDMVFLLVKYLSSEDKLIILHRFTEVKKEDCLGWVIAQSLSYPHNEDSVVLEWLKNSNVNQFLVKIVEKEIYDECPTELNNLLKLAFRESKNEDLYISKAAVCEIVQKLKNLLLSSSDYPSTVDACASLSAYMSLIIYSETFLLTYGDELLLALFTFSCKNQTPTEILSQDTLWEVNTAWQDAITMISAHLPKEEFKNMTSKLAKIIESEILNNQIDNINLEHFTDILVSFVRCTQKSVSFQTSDLLLMFFSCDFIPSWKWVILVLCKTVECIKGKLSLPDMSLDEVNENISEVDIVKFLMISNLKVSVFSSYLEELDSESDSEDDCIEKGGLDLIAKVVDNLEEHIVDILFDITLGRSFVENYKTVQHTDRITDQCNQMLTKVKVITKSLNNEMLSNIKQQITTNLFNESWLWSKTFYLYHVDVVNTVELNTIYEKCLNEDTHLGRLHLTQVFASHIKSINENFTNSERIILLRSLLHCDNADNIINDLLNNIEDFRLIKDSWDGSPVTIELLRLCSCLIEFKVKSLTREHWDFIVLSLASCSTIVMKAKSMYRKPNVSALTIAVMNLFSQVDSYVRNLEKENPSDSFVCEWNDLFVQTIHTDIVQIWYYLAEQFQHQEEFHITILPLVEEFDEVFKHLNYNFICKSNDGSLPKWSKFLKHCCSLLTHPKSSVQIWSYKMLVVLIPGLVEVDSVSVITNTPHEKGLIFEQFKDLLLRTQEIVQSMLLDFKLGEDSCRVKPFTDSYTYTFAYLLLWDILLSLCEKSSTELRYQYADWLRKEDFLKNLLTNIFRLMPTKVLHCLDGKTKPLADLFVSKPNFKLSDVCTSSLLEHFVCSLYTSVLSQLPALVRLWWSGAEPRIAQIVERVTAAYVSPQLCLRELSEIENHENKFKNMTVIVYPSVREVVAIYKVDEAQMELIITLPTNYPLGGPDVQCNRQIGGTSHRQWLMQLKMCVLHQNGRILDGLSLWNNNLDKKFDGVEECFICYAVLHPGTYQLPKLSCQTCKKKFHSACLYKWFSTSHKSTCPICRNLF